MLASEADGPASLLEAHANALALIANAHRAWMALADLAAEGIGREVIDQLVARDLVAIWEKSARTALKNGPYAVLTPLGLWRSEVYVTERSKKVAPAGTRRHRVTCYEEWPEVITVNCDDGTTRTLPSLTAIVERQRHPKTPPQFGTSLPFPEEVPDPLPGPEYMVDEHENPVKILGQSVVIDWRLAKKGRKPKRKRA